MKTLIELNRLTKKQSRFIDYQIPKKEDSPLRKLYHIIDQNQELSDEECMYSIYGKRNITAFSRLKSRLKDIYYQALIFFDPGGMETIESFQEGIELYRQTIACRILNNRKAFNLSNELLERSVNKSIKLSLTENVLSQIRLLIQYNATIATDDFKGNKYRFKKYIDLQDKYLEYYRWELISEKYYLDLHRSQARTFSNATVELKNKAYNYYVKLKDVKHVDSIDFEYNRYRIHAAYLEYNKEFDELLRISKAILAKFALKTYVLDSVISNVNVRIIWASIQSGDFVLANEFGSNLLGEIQQFSPQWYRIAYYTLKARIYLEEYNSAAELLITILNSRNYEKLSEYYKEIFNTTLGYVSLLLGASSIQLDSEVKEKLPEFKIGKYLNTTVVFNKDKRGANVSILLLSIAFMLKKGDYNSIIDKIDSLNQYAYRYLRKDDTFRSNAFIKMVVQIAKADFNYIRIQRYTAELLKQLNSVNLAGSGENIEIEVIPFENLWKLMLSFIELEK